jgi:cytoskeletal protein CcmA (bactofilin family)
MLNKILAVFILLLFISVGPIQGKKEKKLSQLGKTASGEIHGSVHYSDVKLPRVNVKGKAIFERVLVKDSAVIRGKLDLIYSKLAGDLDAKGKLNLSYSMVAGDLNAQGCIKMNQTTVAGQARIHGQLQANHTTFQDDLHLVSSEPVLNNVAAQNIYLREVATRSCSGLFKKTCKIVYNPPVLTLTGKTIIHGSIIFENEDGTVRENNDGTIWLGKEASIKGAVIGGIIKPIE